MSFERPKMSAPEKNPAPAPEKKETPEENDQRHKEFQEMFEKLRDLEEVEYEAKQAYKNAHFEYTQALKNKITLKDKIRSFGKGTGTSGEHLQGLLTEKDKATLEKLEK